ncbi:flagellar motor protein MotB [Modestobacter sp. VKM Ac-2986]|uniref:OmpA/MotB family protein n=1 Tax=Modestobacter sp. VKM Ac-2986 TaxID=3004140 RepID=UPI0022AB8A20|nr:flagellar motor protein MotB [Modestobacter sp. VKM Ac-2986]MCZ2830275.1 flagellar motor protein MotB [Modestobacter sp. VKM Ac-2986]
MSKTGKSGKGGHGGHGGRAKKHEEHEEHENHERWLVSGFDMMTLLFVLFVVLYAMSSIDAAKFTAFAEGAREGGGAPVTILNDGAAIDAPTENDSPLKPVQVAQEAAIDGTAQTAAEAAAAEAVAADQAERTAAEAKAVYDQLAAAREALAAAVAAAGQAGSAEFVIDERGLVVRVVSDPVLFEPESAVLLPAGKTVLDALAPGLSALPNPLRVEGHANSLPVTRGGPWPSNWELSAIRATTVLRHLSEADGLAEDRMSAAGYGSTRPLVPDSDPSFVTVNRRVDIVVASTASPGANALLPGLEAAAQDGTAAPAAGTQGATTVSTTEDAGHGTTDSEGGHG